MNLDKKIGKTSILNLCLQGLALLMAALFLFMFLGEFFYGNLDLGIVSLRGGSTGNNLIFREEPIAGLLVAWIFGLLVVLGLIAVLVLNFVKAVKLPKIAIPACLCFLGVFLLTAGILCFCTTGLIGGGSLGVAAVFAGIFGIVGFAAAGLAAFFSFKE